MKGVCCCKCSWQVLAVLPEEDCGRTDGKLTKERNGSIL